MPAIRAVVITGAGRAFSTGAELKEAAEQAENGPIDVYGVLTERYHPIIGCIGGCPAPSPSTAPRLAWALPGLACDLVVAAESAYFMLAFVNIGLVPNGGSAVRTIASGFAELPNWPCLGTGSMPPWRSTGGWSPVWPDDTFASRDGGLLDRLASGAAQSHAGTKRLLNKWLYEQMDDQFEFEAQTQGNRGFWRFRRRDQGFRRKAGTRFTGV